MSDVSQQRHALVASYDIPRPDRDSGSQRTFDLIDHLLDDGWRVTFVACDPDGEGRERYRRVLRRRGVAVYDGVEAAEQVIAVGGLDLAVFAFWQIAELMMPWVREVSPDTRIVIDSIDVQFVRYIRRLPSLAANGPIELLDDDDAEEFRGELNAYLAADAVITVSQTEAELLAVLTGRRDLAYTVPDQEVVVAGGGDFDARSGLVFVASFRWAPNIDGARFLVQEVLPLIDGDLLAAHPLTLVGDGLDEILSTIGSSPHVVPVGWVPTLAPYLHRARVAVVPLRYGAGTKRKTIQALASGTPTVVTPIGGEGLDLEHGRHVLIAEDAPGLAAQIERLLTDRGLWERLRADGLTLIEATRSHRVAAESLRAVVADVAGRPAAREVERRLGREARFARYQRRTMYQSSQQLLPSLRELLARHVAHDEVVLVVTDGQPGALRYGGPGAQHFPQHPDGSWRYERPSDTPALVAELERLAATGVRHLLVPKWSAWFLDQYPGVDRALRFVADARDCGRLFEIVAPRSTPAPGAIERVLEPAPPAMRPLGGDPGAPQLIAFYLPQYHPIAQNDEWWGPGFTDWRNVAKAEPLFPGHEQPRLPSDLGYYDLRLPEVRAEQADLAREYGITAFCHYHYWFGGQQLLERPFDEVLASGEPDFPFTLCWANEPWSRRWDGREHDVLQPQRYSPADDVEHIRHLLPALADARAVRVDGRPLLTIYQAWALPDPRRTVDTWKAEVERAGLGELYLCAVETGWDEDRDFTDAGFDAKILFQPQFSILSRVPQLHLGPGSLRVFDYETASRALAQPNPVAYRRFETVCPAWDNSPRRQRDGWVLHGSTPQKYQAWLTGALERAMAEPPEQRLVFVNAWNEWAEGCHLEPDHRHGRAYLEATARALGAVSAGQGMAMAGRRSREDA